MASMAVRKVMRLGRAGTLTYFVLALVVAAVISLVLAARPALSAPTTFTVNSTGDAGDESPEGTCDSDTTEEAVVCTLREAIQEANANNNPTEMDTIIFAIPGAGPHTILPTSDLPPITQKVTINGYSESLGEGDTPARPNSRRDVAQGTNANLLIELSGGSISGSNGLIQVNASDVVVRGLVLKCFNTGIFIFGGSGNVIRGNFIGNDPSVCTVNDGVVVSGSSSNNIIGGTTPAARNVISGNLSQGLTIFGNGSNTIQGNLIGTRADGTDPLGNAEGVEIFSPNNTVGGIDRDPTDAISPANLIAHNGEGVQIIGGIDNAFAVNNRILSNSIFSNGGTAEGALGIDLDGGEGFSNPDGDGVTANDQKDPDTGPNRLQNFPILTSFQPTASGITIDGRLNSRPGKTFIIQFFSSPSGNEGQRFLGGMQVSTNRNGNTGIFSFPTELRTGEEVITATATRLNTSTVPATPTDTSEFSRMLVVN